MLACLSVLADYMDLCDLFAEKVQTVDEYETLVDSFGQAVSAVALSLGKVDASSPEFASLELEARLWSLLSQKSVDPETILSWLQEGIPEPEEPIELKSIKWMHTKDHARRSVMSNHESGIVDQLDPDAQLRQQKRLDPQDARADAILFEYLFKLLLGGQFDRASTVCARSNNWTLKAAIDGHDNPVVARAAYAVAQASLLCEHERGIYGLLAGDVPRVATLCYTWEELFVAYMNAFVRKLQVANLSEKDKQELSALSPPSCTYTSLRDIVDALAKNSSPNVREQAQNPYRKLLAAILLGSFESFEQQEGNCLKAAVADASLPKPASLDNPDFARCLVHVSLSLSKRDSMHKPDESLLWAYIESLTLAKKPHWVPGYVRYLEGPVRIQSYARLLAQTRDPAARQLQIQLANQFGLDLEASIREAVILVARNIEEDARASGDEALRKIAAAVAYDADPGEPLEFNFGDAASSSELSLASVISWFEDANYWRDAALVQARFFHALLCVNRPLAAAQISRTLAPRAAVTKGVDAPESMRTELILYTDIVDSVYAISLWDSQKDPAAVESAIKYVRALCTPPPIPSLLHLCKSYVPSLVLELTRVLKEAKTLGPYLQEILSFAVNIADEKNAVYLLFGNRLSEFIFRCAEAVSAL